MKAVPNHTQPDNSPLREFTGKLTSKGQVTIPQEVRQLLGVKPHQAVVFRVEHGRVELLPGAITLEEAFGAVPPLSKPENFKKLRHAAIEEHVLAKNGNL